MNEKSTHDYSVGWYDDMDNTRGVVKGEEGMYDWAEAEEVCSHFAAEDDGLAYYVSDRQGNPVEPSNEEALELLNSFVKNGVMGWAERDMLKRFIR